MKPEAVNVGAFSSTSSSQSAEADDVQFAPLHYQPQQIRIICLSYTERSKLSQSPTQKVRSNSSNISPRGVAFIFNQLCDIFNPFSTL